MAVPASGNSLSLGSIAFEKLEDDYSNGAQGSIDTSYGPFSLRDITLGGSSTVGAEDYDVTNAISPSHPDNDASYGMSEFYSYDHDFAAPGCNLAYESGQNGEFNYPVELGTATGNIRIEYEAYGVPDRFEFTWNGNTYISGSSSGNYDGYVGDPTTGRTNDLRTATGDPNVEIYSNAQGGIYTGGRGYIIFNKNSSASTGSMNVKAPLGGTQWWFSVSCPGMQVITNNPGIAPSITASTITVNVSSVTMGGNVTNKGLTSNFSTAGTISSKGFVVKLGVTATAEFLIGESGVTNVLEDDSTINTTGSFNESITGTSSLNGVVATNTASSITETSFVGGLSKTSLGATPNSFRAYATNSAGTTYSSIINVNNTGSSSESGIVYCNQSYSSTPSVNNNSGSISASTGNQWNQLQGSSTSTGTVSSTINESQVSLLASNTYRYRAVMRQSSTLHYGAVKSFTVSASYSFTSTVTVGSDQYYSTLAYGFADLNWPDMGSMSNRSFNSNTIMGIYWQNNASGTDYVYLVFFGPKPSFTELIIGSTNLGASSSWTSQSTIMWRKAQSSNPFAGTGGTTVIQANY
tara:strand:+ start:600 stop:2336 length:1737 start_codon:yes stop_codon:yes gene_type:complete